MWESDRDGKVHDTNLLCHQPQDCLGFAFIHPPYHFPARHIVLRMTALFFGCDRSPAPTITPPTPSPLQPVSAVILMRLIRKEKVQCFAFLTPGFMAVWRIFNEPQQRRRLPSERRLRTADEHWEAPSRPCTVGGSRGGQAVLSHSVFYVVMSDVYAMSRTCVSTPGLVCFPVSVLSNVWSSRCFRRGECPCAGLLFTKG